MLKRLRFPGCCSAPYEKAALLDFRLLFAYDDAKETIGMSFVHLNVHTNFSMLEGASRIEDLVRAAAAMNMPAVALTDTDGMYAVVPFVRACESAGIRPIFGVELTEPFPVEVQPAQRMALPAARKALLLARDSGGYRSLCRIITDRHLQKNFPWEEAVAGLPESVFVITSEEKVLRRRVARRCCRDATRVEICTGPGVEGRSERNRLLELALRLEIKPVVTGGVRFKSPEDYPVHCLLSALRWNTTTGRLPKDKIAAPWAYLMPPERIEAQYHHAPLAVKESVAVASECDVRLDLSSRKLPRFPVPGGGDPYLYLRGLALRGLTERFSVERMASARRVLDRELNVIQRMKLSDYFLICWDIVRHARSRQIPCLGRGSAANSIVSFCLYITHVDPLAHNLFFERFLNDQRTSMPDFDLDFGTEDREDVLDYIFDSYGNNRAAMIGTHVTLQARGSFREVAVAMGLPKGEVDEFIKKLPHFGDADHLEEKLKTSPETDDLPLDREPFASIYRMAQRISGFPRHMATHPCGLVIAPEPIDQYMPMQRGDKGFAVTQWSMYPVEDAGLLKIDILGQKGLEVISYTACAARQQGYSLPDDPREYLSDSRTRDWMREGRTIGCFYIESPAMIGLIKQARCDDFECLTALSSIIRPGVSNYGGKHAYLRRHLKLEPETVLHPLLLPILHDTKGCLIYQEQVIRIASELAGLSLGESDDLRRLMSFKKNRHRLSDYRTRFFEGCRQKSLPDGITEEIYRQVESFAGYAFCKAHSASFALESFESMYYKSHFTAEFMAAVLSGGGGYYGALEYLEEARRLGVAVHSPCINGSEYRFTGENGHLRIGLMQVKSLSEETAERIVWERHQKGPYRDVFDFLARVSPTIEEARNLAKCGAMRSIGHTVPETLWAVEIFFSRSADSAQNNSDIKPLDSMRSLWSEIPALPDPAPAQLMEWELEILGLTPTAHPFRMFTDEIRHVRKLRPVVRSVDLAARSGRETYVLGWRIIGKKTRTKNSQQLMLFVTFSDEWGRFETTFFPNSFTRNAKELLKGPGPFLLKGRVDVELGLPMLVADQVQLITRKHVAIRPTYGSARKHLRTRMEERRQNQYA